MMHSEKENVTEHSSTQPAPGTIRPWGEAFSTDWTRSGNCPNTFEPLKKKALSCDSHISETSESHIVRFQVTVQILLDLTAAESVELDVCWFWFWVSRNRTGFFYGPQKQHSSIIMSLFTTSAYVSACTALKRLRPAARTSRHRWINAARWDWRGPGLCSCSKWM